MAWRYRKSINFGPLRFNISKSGIGTSIGVKGFRVGQSATGKVYSQTTIPGTGIYRRDTYKQNAKPEGLATGEAYISQSQAVVTMTVIILFFVALAHC